VTTSACRLCAHTPVNPVGPAAALPQVFECPVCNFRQSELPQDHADRIRHSPLPDLEAISSASRRTTRLVLELLYPFAPDGRLLDVGTGSGTLIEEAVNRAYVAEGVEPSRALASSVQQRQLPVRPLALPTEERFGPYDAITAVRVLEEVAHPAAFMTDLVSRLAPGGVCLVVTPDVRSFAARKLQKKWWHYHPAAYNFFSEATLNRLMSDSGLDVVFRRRVPDYLPVEFLFARLAALLPEKWRRKLDCPAALHGYAVGLNTFDLLLYIGRKPGQPHNLPPT